MKIAASRGQFAEQFAVILETMGDEMDHAASGFPFPLARPIGIRHTAGEVAASGDAVVALQDTIDRQQR